MGVPRRPPPPRTSDVTSLLLFGPRLNIPSLRGRPVGALTVLFCRWVLADGFVPTGATFSNPFSRSSARRFPLPSTLPFSSPFALLASTGFLERLERVPLSSRLPLRLVSSPFRERPAPSLRRSADSVLVGFRSVGRRLSPLNDEGGGSGSGGEASGGAWACAFIFSGLAFI